ncbi:type II toxin-antitoxin system VapB family antitoxin [Bradyrhizobium sp. S69]|uniref:type II toxin-antitoxin system VapB family antitoxin n=1 Tax=Bradyrhizobium sp. S69 TaxID=1641856 RepID=UPI00131D4C73|nr:type II toxin-antitoxin system VapB family antitoxin [Bradyrhizobium sp. S69]
MNGIFTDEAHKLATELAGLTGESLTSAVTLALQERLARERRRRRPDQVAARLMKIGSQYSALADTGRSPDEILGHDDQGLPTWVFIAARYRSRDISIINPDSESSRHDDTSCEPARLFVSGSR